jgi:hypothetical protein
MLLSMIMRVFAGRGVDAAGSPPADLAAIRILPHDFRYRPTARSPPLPRHEANA